jgi:hypothetical protein
MPPPVYTPEGDPPVEVGQKPGKGDLRLSENEERRSTLR